MYDPHPNFVTPPDDTVVWRYMDFTKFVSLLDSGNIFFTSMVSFCEYDRHECTYPQVNWDIWDAADAGRPCPAQWMSPADWQQMLGMAQATKPQGGLRVLHNTMLDYARMSTAVNCWRMGDTESNAMWKVFLQSAEGVAIRSTVGRLKQAFAASPEKVIIGEVVYTDGCTVPMHANNLFYPVFHKTTFYEYEKELRLIVTNHNQSPSGFSQTVAVDLDTLIEEVYVAPQTQPWFQRLTEKVLTKYNLGHKVVQLSGI